MILCQKNIKKSAKLSAKGKLRKIYKHTAINAILFYTIINQIDTAIIVMDRFEKNTYI
ncbi:MAG: hypothetical protein ABSH12_05750 [Endomicrobiales bacterium]|jgi:hypothetical protein